MSGENVENKDDGFIGKMLTLVVCLGMLMAMTPELSRVFGFSDLGEIFTTENVSNISKMPTSSAGKLFLDYNNIVEIGVTVAGEFKRLGYGYLDGYGVICSATHVYENMSTHKNLGHEIRIKLNNANIVPIFHDVSWGGAVGVHDNKVNCSTDRRLDNVLYDPIKNIQLLKVKGNAYLESAYRSAVGSVDAYIASNLYAVPGGQYYYETTSGTPVFSADSQYEGGINHVEQVNNNGNWQIAFYQDQHNTLSFAGVVTD